MVPRVVYITEVHMSGGAGHMHIAAVRWRDPRDGQCGSSTREMMVDWIGNKNGTARVRHGTDDVKVGVVNAKPPYIRTYADGEWSDNLLALPRY
jgi:hypothetical protein